MQPLTNMFTINYNWVSGDFSALQIGVAERVTTTQSKGLEDVLIYMYMIAIMDV